MTDCVIAGAGASKFHRKWNLPVAALGRDAVEAALADAGIEAAAIQAVYVGHVDEGNCGGQGILLECGLPEAPVVNVENACASGGTALQQAWAAVKAGLYETVLVLGIEKVGQGPVQIGDIDAAKGLGFIIPASYAVAAQRHMYEYGSTAEQFALVSVKSRANAAHNPIAIYREPVTQDEVLASRMIAEPLTLLQCATPASGAAAVVVTSATSPLAKRAPSPIKILACAIDAKFRPAGLEDITYLDTTARAAARAYEWAGVGPHDIEVAEVHDAFSIGEIVHCEGLGFCPRGEGGRLAQEGATSIHGRIPVNPSGGLLSRGHPHGARERHCGSVRDLSAAGWARGRSSGGAPPPRTRAERGRHFGKHRRGKRHHPRVLTAGPAETKQCQA